MLIETIATIYSAESFHSSKTNKDYHRVGLLIEGVATTLFLDDKPWAELVKQSYFNALSVSHKTQEVKAKLEVKFTEKGAQVYLREISDVKKS